MGKKVLITGITALALALLTSFCATSRLERRLDPQSEEFFSKARMELEIEKLLLKM